MPAARRGTEGEGHEQAKRAQDGAAAGGRPDEDRRSGQAGCRGRPAGPRPTAFPTGAVPPGGGTLRAARPASTARPSGRVPGPRSAGPRTAVPGRALCGFARSERAGLPVSRSAEHLAPRGRSAGTSLLSRGTPLPRRCGACQTRDSAGGAAPIGRCFTASDAHPAPGGR